MKNEQLGQGVGATLKWSTTRPALSGWYWWREYDTWSGTIVAVEVRDGSVMHASGGGGLWAPPASAEQQWAGPIVAPGSPTPTPDFAAMARRVEVVRDSVSVLAYTKLDSYVGNSRIDSAVRELNALATALRAEWAGGHGAEPWKCGSCGGPVICQNCQPAGAGEAYYEMQPVLQDPRTELRNLRELAGLAVEALDAQVAADHHGNCICCICEDALDAFASLRAALDTGEGE